MAIRITNNTSGRTIIVRNQNDMNHLDDTFTSIDSSKRDWDLVGSPKSHAPGTYDAGSTFNDPPNSGSDTKNRRVYKSSGQNDDWFNYDDFDAEIGQHYRDASAYPLSKEIQSWSDPTTVDTPIIKLKNTDIPDDQTVAPDDANQFGNDPSQQPQDDDSFPAANDLEASTEDEQDSDFQGMIRTVHGACLVYKRKDENGTFDELWIYNVGTDLKTETAIRKSILAGTDIDPNTQISDDGSQKAKTYTVGNVQFLKLIGLVQ